MVSRRCPAQGVRGGYEFWCSLLAGLGGPCLKVLGPSPQLPDSRSLGLATACLRRPSYLAGGTPPSLTAALVDWGVPPSGQAVSGGGGAVLQQAGTPILAGADSLHMLMDCAFAHGSRTAAAIASACLGGEKVGVRNYPWYLRFPGFP